jgi:hypothetical protein
MASPHVAGAWAILKQKKSNATVDQVLAVLQTTSKPIKDTRSSNLREQWVQCRIKVKSALDRLTQQFVLTSGGSTVIYDMNKCGQQVGTATAGAILISDGTTTAIDVPNSDGTMPRGINDLGEISGTYVKQVTGQSAGFLRSPTGSFTTFDASGGDYTDTFGINNAGQIVGTRGHNGGPNPGSGEAFIRSLDGSFEFFTVDGAYATWATDIDDIGRVVGSFVIIADGDGRCDDPITPINCTEGFLRDETGSISVVNVDNAQHTLPYGISKSGQISGSAVVNVAPFQPFYFVGFRKPFNGQISLIDPPVGNKTEAYGITNSEQIVGKYFSGSTGRFIHNSLLP